MKHVLADHFRAQLYNNLKKTFFSIIMDETTDISSENLLAIVVRFFCAKEKRVKSQFLKLLEVAESDADTLVQALTFFLTKTRFHCPILLVICLIQLT